MFHVDCYQRLITRVSLVIQEHLIIRMHLVMRGSMLNSKRVVIELYVMVKVVTICVCCRRPVVRAENAGGWLRDDARPV